MVGWLNTRKFDETGSAEQAVSWSPFVLDTNGNGKLDSTETTLGTTIAGSDGTWTFTTESDLADGTYKVNDGAANFTIPNRDFRNLSWRSNVVLKWEWRPGSTLYAVWQQNRASSTTDGSPIGSSELFDSWSAPGDNIFLVKTTVWLSR